MEEKLAGYVKKFGEKNCGLIIERYLTSRAKQRSRAKDQREKARKYDEYLASQTK